jgi:two-component system, NarL family, sensor histidine kinase DevS
VEASPSAEDRFRRLIEVGRGVLAELDVEALLLTVVEAARELTGARYAALGVLDEAKEGLERFIHTGIDDATRRMIGDLPRGRGVLGELIRNPEPLRLAHVSDHPHSYGFPAGHPPMRSFLGVPISIRGEAYGNLYITEKAGGQEFTEADEEAMVILAGWAAIAVATAQTVERGRLRERVEAAERERHHWAHELHDEALQQLAAIRLQLAAALRSAPSGTESDPLREAARRTVIRLEEEIDNLSRLINELRPVPLETLGLRRALEALAEETTDKTGIAVDARIDVPEELPPDTERTVYRLFQESLTNVIKHSEAGRAEMAVAQVNGALTLKVSDDGAGFDPSAVSSGVGLRGMKERVEVLGGALEIVSWPGEGTEVTARVPIDS